EVANSFLINRSLIAKDADGHHGCHVAEVPVGPVVINPRVIMASEEILIDGQEYLAHHLLKARKILRLPAFVSAHDLSRIGELISIDTRRQANISRAAELLQRSRPSVQDRDGFLRIGAVARDTPPQRT